MSYLTLDEVKSAIKAAGREGEEFYEVHPEEELDDLLDELEKRSRAIINNQLKGEGYEQETDRTDTVDAPDKPHLQLVRPVDDVTKVEVSTQPDKWETLDTEVYSFDEQKVKLRQSLIPNQNEFFNVQNPLLQQSNRATWARICDRVRVTYDRGYTVDNIPYSIKEVQQEIIRRMLVHYRQEQNLANLNPDEVQGFNSRQILTDDIKTRVGEITQNKNAFVMLR